MVTLEVGAAAPFRGAAVTLTKVDPHDIESCWAADV